MYVYAANNIQYKYRERYRVKADTHRGIPMVSFYVDGTAERSDQRSSVKHADASSAITAVNY